VSTTELVGDNGRVVALRGHEVGPPPGFDKIEGTDFEIKADLVLLAMGFLHTQHDTLIEQLSVDLDGRGNIDAAAYETSVPGVFAAGDARRGQSLVVWAINEGRKAARAADAYLSELDDEPGEDPVSALLKA
jgi:glutamate synthase (NADPH) small chain